MFNKDFRPRRLRTSDTLRRMVRETRISADSLIWPIFIIEGEGICDEIPSLPGQYHYSPDMLGRAVERMRAHGVSRVLLFGLPKHKDENGSSAWDSNGVVQQGIRALRAIAPELYIITDVCMCEYTSHGHCGILCGHYVDNDRTLEVLARTAVSHARAGADMVAPSDMMDGRVAAIRATLDSEALDDVSIMAYTAKYASALYGPFRGALESAPKEGDKKTYQMDPGNIREALREAQLDEAEGADILMVKPATLYLDVMAAMRKQVTLPIAAYHVSGEYLMIKSAAASGWLDERETVLETLISIRRAGADMILTYYAPQAAEWLQQR